MNMILSVSLALPCSPAMAHVGGREESANPYTGKPGTMDGVTSDPEPSLDEAPLGARLVRSKQGLRQGC